MSSFDGIVLLPSWVQSLPPNKKGAALLPEIGKVLLDESIEERTQKHLSFKSLFGE